VLDKELAAAHRDGANDIAKVHRATIADYNTGLALGWPNQRQFNVLKYLDGLARSSLRAARFITVLLSSDARDQSYACGLLEHLDILSSHRVPIESLLHIATAAHSSFLRAVVRQNSVQSFCERALSL
jgi:hypothetical protein